MNAFILQLESPAYDDYHVAAFDRENATEEQLKTYETVVKAIEDMHIAGSIAGLSLESSVEIRRKQ